MVSKMSSTVRVYVNDKRIATGKIWKGQFLQVFPDKKTFASEADWRTAIYESLIPTIKFVTTESKPPKKQKANEIVKPIPIRAAPVKPEPAPVKPEPAPVKPQPAPVKPAKKPVLNPESEDEDEEVGDNMWTCGYCRLPAGNDHRMCICKGYNYSVAAWEEGRIYPAKTKAKETIPLSKNSKDWTFERTSRATFPPGRYYIGDLCYALDDTLYDKVFGPQYRSGKYTMPNEPSHAFMMGDTGGDGEFRGTDGFNYPVDAGIIGIAAESTLDPAKAPYDGGRMYTFKGNVSVHCRNDKFRFSSDNYTDESLTIFITEDNEDDYD